MIHFFLPLAKWSERECDQENYVLYTIFFSLNFMRMLGSPNSAEAGFVLETKNCTRFAESLQVHKKSGTEIVLLAFYKSH